MSLSSPSDPFAFLSVINLFDGSIFISTDIAAKSSSLEILMLFAIVLLIAFGYILLTLGVGYARMKYKVQAPATVGHPVFERLSRIHANTGEQLTVFFIALAATIFLAGSGVAAIFAFLWLVARIIYGVGYAAEAHRRGIGFQLAIGTVLVMIILDAAILCSKTAILLQNPALF